MNLGKDITNLLKKQPQVYVNGLGVFSRIHSSATFDSKQQVYLPPISYIEFDADATQGFDFAFYLQQVLEIPYQDALSLLASKVEDIHTKIKEDGKYNLESLGQLVLYGNDYVFKAQDLSGFQFDAVASGSGHVPPVIQEEVKTVEEILEEQPVEEIPPVDENQPLTAEIIQETYPFETEDLPKKSNNSLWFLALTVLILALVLGTWYYQNVLKKPQTDLGSSDSTKIDPDTLAINNPPIDSLDLVLTDTLGNADSVKNAGDSAKLVNTVDKKHHYQIVIGTYPTLAQAYEAAESFHKAGYPAVKVIPSNMARNKKKVIWDSYLTKEEADSALVYVKKHFVADAWRDKIK
ncbi:hypothetical protein [Sphingobacterium hungaricum]